MHNIRKDLAPLSPHEFTKWKFRRLLDNDSAPYLVAQSTEQVHEVAIRAHCGREQKAVPKDEGGLDI